MRIALSVDHTFTTCQKKFTISFNNQKRIKKWIKQPIIMDLTWDFQSQTLNMKTKKSLDKYLEMA